MLGKILPQQFSEFIDKDKKPLAIAFSGGGDSTALLYAILEWVKCNDPKNEPENETREIIALIVDHGLRAGSDDEAKLAAKRARHMGAKTEILTWVGDKPDTAIQEKARNARYALLGDACRRLGLTQLFLGHNQDDQAETVYMRAQKGSGWRGMAGMSTRRYAPLWPALYGVDIIRPLLGVSREDLRCFNARKNLAYIDDPSNENQKFARIRIRETLATMPDIKQQLLRVGAASQEKLAEEIQAISLFLFRSAHILEWGGVHVNIDNIIAYKKLTADSKISADEAFKYLILAVSGGSHVPSQEQRQNLVKQLVSDTFKGATLGGVQFIPDGETVLLVRDPGAVMGRHQKPALATMKILPNTPVIWDGRYKIGTRVEGVSIAPLMAHSEKLSKVQNRKLKEIPNSGRAGLPCLLSSEGVFVPYLDAPNDKFTVDCLVKERLRRMGVLRGNV
ncbi:MAG: tRNA lysidine(34) synthetase TilS [Robiginitomaculum sp.]|nr:tRNA lysidine(34) synthetase TilS [Robiginitomaculum sp.]